MAKRVIINRKGIKMKKIIGLALVFLFSSQIQAGDAAKGQTKTAVCAGCHMADGNSVIAANPKLAGQGEKYLIKQLREFKTKARDNATMFGMASMLSDSDILDVAAYYSSQKIQHSTVDAKYIEIAQKIYRGGDSDRDIPACIACHAADGTGIATAGFPAIGGQHPEYTSNTLKAFRSGARSNDLNNVMRDVVAKMSDEQIEALSFYLAGLH
jgi:cytochrome c553